MLHVKINSVKKDELGTHIHLAWARVKAAIWSNKKWHQLIYGDPQDLDSQEEDNLRV